MALARYELLQLARATAALDELGTRYITTVESNRERRGVAAEWGRLLTGARYKARTTQSTVLRDDVTVISPNGTGNLDEVLPPDCGHVDDDAFWTWPSSSASTRMPEPRWRHRGRSWPSSSPAPSAKYPRPSCYPTSSTTEASLNLTLALVGRSGDGKGGAVAVARRAVNIGSPEFHVHTLGSGQGIAHGYGHWEPPKTASPARLSNTPTSVLFTVEEVDHLAAHHNQNASTTLAELRRFSMGEKLGHLYVDRTSRVEIPAHPYRGAVIVGVQPARAGVILDDVEGGTPQRFTWWPTIDHHPPDANPTDRSRGHGHHRTGSPSSTGSPGGDPSLSAQPSGRRPRNPPGPPTSGEGDPLDGHALLTRERIAAALGILNGH